MDVRQLIDDPTDPQSEKYFEFHLLPFGYHYELQCLCSSGGAPWALLTFSRGQQRGEFQKADLRLLSVVAAHIGKAVRRVEIQGMRHSLPGHASGVILLDHHGDLVFASEVAREWLDEVHSDAAWRLGLEVAVKMASNPGGTGSGVEEFTLRRPDNGQLYRLRVDGAPTEDGKVALFIEPARPADAVGNPLRLGLSPREADVALNLVRGLDTAAISSVMGCTPHTVRQHQKQVFQKLEVSSRLELASNLLGPAPI